ncbi:MAG: peptide chain release factor N(5)-glutamine methyltransferase [Oscillospiraceae bacterium]|nr:peptide chain release factor N(5)-glutamine methyltransferase [Oscillospiraceae bacterium]
MVKKYADLYLETRRALLTQEDPQSAGLMARNLIALYSGHSQEYILGNRELYAGEAVCDKVERAVERLLKGEPLAYVLGEWEFYGLPLFVNENVLIPRDDTVAVASLALKQAIFLPPDPRILDLCTGSGCIGLAVASRIKDARVTLADISKDALAVAKKNIARHKLTGRVSCMQVDAMRPAPAFLGKFDMIISNPPYITDAEMPQLQDSVKLYEPHLALCGGADGLDFYRSIAVNFSAALKPGGFLCLEFGEEQCDDICRILEENGYTILERSRDYNDTERAVLAQYGRKEE